MRPLAAAGLALCVLSGCQVVLGLDEVKPPPACVYSQDPVDEDCDGRANDKDPCPADGGGAADADSDGDGIGDACDPSPVADRARLFDGFGMASPAWTAMSGDWHVEGGALHNAMYDGANYAVVDLMRGAGMTVVEALDRDPAVSNPTVTLYATIDVLISVEVDCSVVVPATGPSTLVFGSATKTFTGTGRLRIALGQQPDGTTHCRAHYGSDVDTDIAAGNSGDSIVSITQVGVKTSGVRAQFDSVSAYSQ